MTNMASGSAIVAAGVWRWCWPRGSAGRGAYLACALFASAGDARPGLVLGEPERHREPTASARTRGDRRLDRRAVRRVLPARRVRSIILVFILIHKIGDTLGQIVLRLMLNDLGFTNDEIAIYDVGVGFWAYLIGIFVGGVAVCAAGAEAVGADQPGADGVSNVSFALLAAAGHSNAGLAGAIGVREYRQRDRRRDRDRVFLGAVRPALHRGAICADLGGRERGRAAADRDHRRRAGRARSAMSTSTG